MKYLLLTLALALTSHAADRVKELASHLPDGVAAVLAVRSVSKLQADWEQSPSGKMLEDPAIKKWLAPSLDADGRFKWQKEWEAKLGCKLQDWLSLHTGAAVMGLLPVPNAAPGAAFIAETTADGAALTALFSKALPNGAVLKEEELGGVPVTAVLAKADGPTLHVWAVLKGMSLVTTDRLLMKQLAGSIASGIGKNTSLPLLLDRAKERSGPEVDLILAADLRSLTALAASQIPPAGQMFLTPLGLEDLELFSIATTTSPTRSAAHLSFLHKPDSKGLLPSLLKASANEVSQPAFIPADAASFSVSRYSLEGLYDNVLATITKAGPIAALAMMQVAATEQKLGFQFKPDLLATLDDTIVQMQFPGEGADLVGTTLYAIKLKDQTKFESTLRKLIASMGKDAKDIQETSVEGNLVWSLKPALKDQGMGTFRMSLALAPGYLVFCQGQTAKLEQVLARMKSLEGPSAWQQPGVQDILGQLTAPYSGLSYMYTDRLIAQGLKIFSATSKGEKWFDESSTPSPEVLRKYFGPTASSFYSSADGLRIHAVTDAPH